MKTKLFFLSVLVFLLSSCATKTEENKSAAAVAPVEDSLVALWNDAWNRNDTAAIAAMFNDKSVVISSAKDVITGVDSIMQKWVNNQVKNVANLQTQKLMGGTGESLAYYSGTWTLDLTNDKDSVTGNVMGSFTSAWQKQDDGKWIMTTIQMSE